MAYEGNEMRGERAENKQTFCFVIIRRRKVWGGGGVLLLGGLWMEAEWLVDLLSQMFVEVC